jgi:hypothetical protein
LAQGAIKEFFRKQAGEIRAHLMSEGAGGEHYLQEALLIREEG